MLKKQIKASVEYWIEEEHEINKGFWQQELYEIESDLDQSKPNKLNIVAVDIIFCSFEAIARHALAERV